MDYYEVVRELLGSINPIGETNTDNERYKNLEATLALIDDLVSDVSLITEYSNRPEYSMSRSGKRAKTYLYGLHESILSILKGFV